MVIDNLYIGLGKDLEVDISINKEVDLSNRSDYVNMGKGNEFSSRRLLNFYLNENWELFYNYLYIVISSSKLKDSNININLDKEIVNKLYINYFREQGKIKVDFLKKSFYIQEVKKLNFNLMEII